MLDAENPTTETANPAPPAADPAPTEASAPAKKTAKKTSKKTTAKRTTKKVAEPAATGEATEEATQAPPAKKSAAKKAATKKTSAKRAATKKTAGTTAASAEADGQDDSPQGQAAPPATALLFQPPDPTKAVPRRAKKAATKPAADEGDKPAGQKQAKGRPTETKADELPSEPAKADRGPDRSGDDDDDGDGEQGGNRRRRRRGGRRRRKPGGGDETDAATSDGDDTDDDSDKDGRDDSSSSEAGAGSRRRRRRRRTDQDSDTSSDDPENTVTRVRKPRSAEDEITAVTGSTRLEAKKQRRREGREAGRRRAPIVSEAEFLARREAVERVMVIRQRKDLTQIAVMEDKVLVEHYVARESQTSLIGNVYLGRVQNVLPSMEAAFIDIGKGRNAVLYAGEVNWDTLGAKNGQPRKIESVLKSGQPVLVQVSKDPIGHKGARLTSQINLPGRFLVYVPDGTTSGISRKLPDTERNRLKTLLKEIVPDTAGVIVRTAAEGASEDELTRDVERLTARWDDIASKVEKGNAPQLLYGEPDLTLKVVRDLFTEDFGKLVVSGADAWDMVDGYVEHVAPDLADRLEKYDGGQDVFAAYRIDEQIAKGLDRKVWLPSGGSLIIDRTEAMTVVDVNTGKFTGSGGNLEETVTKNNLEAAEEIVRQLRLRDIGGIIVVDFIDMVLESNRDLVMRRMVECLGRDRTRHQVAEVTSLGLVQMTRKRIGTGLLEAFSENCEHCQGRGLLVHHEPVEPKKRSDDEPRRGRRAGRKGGRGDDDSNGSDSTTSAPSPKDIAAAAKVDRQVDADEVPKQHDKVPEVETPVVDDRAATDVDAGEPVVADKPIAEESKDVTPAEPPASQPVEPAAPRVVTGVRRRSAARRPAGPPVVPVSENAASDGAGSSVDASQNGNPQPELPVETPEHVGQAHVPIKKKGSRKR